jgi:hypothetical protein
MIELFSLSPSTSQYLEELPMLRETLGTPQLTKDFIQLEANFLHWGTYFYLKIMAVLKNVSVLIITQFFISH